MGILKLTTKLLLNLAVIDRRFFKDMPQIALKKKENFDMLE